MAKQINFSETELTQDSWQFSYVYNQWLTNEMINNTKFNFMTCRNKMDKMFFEPLSCRFWYWQVFTDLKLWRIWKYIQYLLLTASCVTLQCAWPFYLSSLMVLNSSGLWALLGETATVINSDKHLQAKYKSPGVQFKK